MDSGKPKKLLIPAESLEKHMNSKLFQKFLHKQGMKSPLTSSVEVTSSKPVQSPLSPELSRHSMESQELRGTSEQIDPGMSYFLYQDMPPMTYSPIPEESNDFREEEITRLRNEYEDLLQAKQAEIHELKEEIDYARKTIEQLETRPSNDGKLRLLRDENRDLQDQLNEIHEKNTCLNNQVEDYKFELHTLKLQYEDMEAGTKNKQQDIETELFTSRQTIENLDLQLIRTKERLMEYEHKAVKAKDKCERVKTNLNRTQERMQWLERELADVRDQQSYELRQLNRENESLRRQLDHMSRTFEHRDRYPEEPYLAPRRKWIDEGSKTDRSFKPEYENNSWNEPREEPEYRNYPKPTQDFERPHREPENFESFERKNEIRPREMRKPRPEENPLDFSREENPRTAVRVKVGAGASPNISNILSWQEGPVRADKAPQETRPSQQPSKEVNLANLENKLLMLQLEKKRIEDEYNKLPSHAKKVSVLKRREELEEELKILNSGISNVKSKLRQHGQLN